MGIYKILEKPQIYNLHVFISSLNNQRLKKYISEMINPKKEDKLLDVGCGTGRYAKINCHYVGIDPNEEYLKYARQRYPGEFIQMGGEELKFPDNSFDQVINISTLHHISDEIIGKMVREMQRVCRPGGKVYVIDAVYPQKSNVIGYLLFRFDRGGNMRTFEQLKDLLGQYGFQVVSNDIGRMWPYRWASFVYQKA